MKQGAQLIIIGGNFVCTLLDENMEASTVFNHLSTQNTIQYDATHLLTASKTMTPRITGSLTTESNPKDIIFFQTFVP